MLFLTAESRSESQAIEDIFNFILRSNLLEKAKNICGMTRMENWGKWGVVAE